MWRIDTRRSGSALDISFWLIAVPALFLLLFFVLPNAVILSTSLLKSQDQVLTNELTTENFELILGKPHYLRAILRTFLVGIAVGLIVALVSLPISYFLVRTRTRYKGLLIVLSLSPLLASVVVRTYGWYVILDRFGFVNNVLIDLGLIVDRIAFIPSTWGIILGLSHAMLPYGILTNIAALSSINPNLESAAMSLGASRTRTLRDILLPLVRPGLVASFLLAFSISISAYATPAILGGYASQTIATLIYTFIMQVLDWSLGAALAAILVIATVAILLLSARFGGKRNDL
ncbi:ABC transporter permease [Psychromarinibacter halotolerans]|uniref:ABC transporter permease n=1 Tax=Psychromarinibacter halotolerans TaxID=1775175 RepID=A0ABV7GWC1_9RHOB|nr:ABC transporter permease [Psychromarinibacter halotolerans]MDF0597543.1 ABC transporter permease [Psychromarinibacter halotolerans]